MSLSNCEDQPGDADGKLEREDSPMRAARAIHTRNPWALHWLVPYLLLTLASALLPTLFLWLKGRDISRSY